MTAHGNIKIQPKEAQRCALLFVKNDFSLLAIPDGTNERQRKAIYDSKHDEYYEVALLTKRKDGIDIGSIAPVPSAYRQYVGDRDSPIEMFPNMLQFFFEADGFAQDGKLKSIQKKIADFLIEGGFTISKHQTTF